MNFMDKPLAAAACAGGTVWQGAPSVDLGNLTRKPRLRPKSQVLEVYPHPHPVCDLLEANRTPPLPACACGCVRRRGRGEENSCEADS